MITRQQIEDRIERLVEAKTNALDRRFLTTDMTQAEYDAEIKVISRWADGQRPSR